MLLDEVTAHLDSKRRAALFGEIIALGGQAWLTGTDPALFAELEGTGQFFSVADAVIAPGGRTRTVIYERPSTPSRGGRIQRAYSQGAARPRRRPHAPSRAYLRPR